MNESKQPRLEEEIAHRAAAFLNREANRTALITVTRALLSRDLRHADIMVTVFPDSYEETALAFLKRKRASMRAYLKDTGRLSHVPTVDFLIDYGEKNRQHLDTLGK